MTVNFWSGFSKRKNSTKQPSAEAAVQRTVRLKENTSVESPVFILDGVGANWDYAQAFGHYYFIDDIVMITNDLAEVHCSQDLLATYKLDIGAYTCFIERAASGYDVLIPDSFLSQKSDYEPSIHADTNIPDFDTTGSYIVRVVGHNGILGYGMSASELTHILQWAFDENNWTAEVQQSLIEGVFNPFQYIVSVRWLPFAVGQFTTGNLNLLKLGLWATDTAYPIVDRLSINKTVTLTLPTLLYNDFRQYDRNWTECNLFIPGIGDVPIDPLYLGGAIDVSYCVDVLTGNLTVTLGDGSGAIIGVFNGNASAEVQIGQSNAGLGGAYAQFASDPAVPPALSAIGQGIGIALNTVFHGAAKNVSMNGNTGSIANLIQRPYMRLSARTMKAKEFPTAVAGRPVMANKQIGTLSGYVKCGNASLSLASLGNDRDEVNALLNGGFYYE